MNIVIHDDYIKITKKCPRCTNPGKTINPQLDDSIIRIMGEVICNEKDTVCKECGFYYTKYILHERIKI